METSSQLIPLYSLMILNLNLNPIPSLPLLNQIKAQVVLAQ